MDLVQVGCSFVDLLSLLSLVVVVDSLVKYLYYYQTQCTWLVITVERPL